MTRGWGSTQRPAAPPIPTTGPTGTAPCSAVGDIQYYRVSATNSVGAGPPSNVGLAAAYGLGVFKSQGVQAHLSAPWNQAGYSGQGIKVGIIDYGSAGGAFLVYRSLMGTELPATVKARCYTGFDRYTSDVATCDSGSDHGTIVAESVADVAPEVSLYIANPGTRGDFGATVDWMTAEGVSVINHSGTVDI